MNGSYLGDRVTQFLERCGIDNAFGIVSRAQHLYPNAIEQRNAIRFLMARARWALPIWPMPALG
ncbi:hypothetical protein FBZ93_1353 [Bradyrhizobium macuxiense]|uniref:Uncharacterized protein n=1 Tax=Bradyrhizobium macuxiense TaxID=1755647 RepID=A0A560KRS2_9BRAD|nr:hypothetical protein [Bradyrhizobium macuxiense]TWB85971.1 hypothetical protein FBZ93_1353 [Bradyrhizobium macuxiense]